MRINEHTWQSRLVLAIVAPWCAVSAVWYTAASLSGAMTGATSGATSGATEIAIGISLGFALVVFLARAATPAGAVTGGIITAVLTLGGPAWYRSALPALLALFVLTWCATKFGHTKKQGLGVAEDKKGRNAAQIAANLGVAGLAATIVFAHGSSGSVIVLAALAEATADTLASELGEVLGGSPLLLTTLRRVPAGTDGAISLAGTLAGITGAIVVVLVGAATLGLRLNDVLTAGFAGICGLFVDSLLGATAERIGLLNNDAVNFLSTLSASVIAALILFVPHLAK